MLCFTRNILLLTALKKTSLISVKLTVSCMVSFSILTTIFSRWTWVSQYQNVSILDFAGAKDDGDGGYNYSCKMCKAPVKSSPPTNQHPVLHPTNIQLQAGCPSCRRTNGVKALKGKALTGNSVSCTKLLDYFLFSRIRC